MIDARDEVKKKGEGTVGDIKRRGRKRQRIKGKAARAPKRPV